MELLLTDTANANQFASLDSTSIAPSAEGKDFAKMVKELALLPKADSPLRTAIEKQYSATKVSETEPGSASPADQSPSELLQQLAESKQMVKGLASAEQTQNKKSELDNLVNTVSADADADIDAQTDVDSNPEQSPSGSKTDFKAGEASGRELPPVAVDNKLAQDSPKQQGEAEVELEAGAKNQVSANSADATTHSQVVASKTDAKEGAILETASTTRNSASNDAQNQSNNAKFTSEATALNPNQANAAKDSLETNSKTENNPNSVPSTSSATSQAKLNNEGAPVGSDHSSAKQPSDAVKPELAQSVTKAELTPVKGESLVESKVAFGQETKLVANKEALPADGNQANKPASNTLEADKVAKSAENAKQLEPSMKRDAEINIANKNSSEPTKQAVGEMSANSQSAETKSLGRDGSNQNRTSAQVVTTTANSSAEHSSGQSDAKTTAANKQPEQSSGLTKEQVVAPQEPKLNAQANNLSSPKASAAEANQVSDKLTDVASQSSSLDDDSNPQDGARRESGQQAQAQFATHVNTTEAARPQDHHSIFRAASGADIVNRADTSNEVSLKQAQQANQVLDKDIQMNQRLNPAHYQAPAELNQRVQYMLSQGMQKAEIRLDPAELGSMHIRLQMNQDQQVSVQIQVQNPQAREALEQTMPRLREMLQQQGIELGQSHVNQQHQGGASQHGQGQSASAGMGRDFDGVDESTEQDLSALLTNQANSEGIDFYA